MVSQYITEAARAPKKNIKKTTPRDITINFRKPMKKRKRAITRRNKD